jgi:poly-gamma-glutamate system protein
MVVLMVNAAGPVAYAGWMPPATITRRVLVALAAASISLWAAFEHWAATAAHARSERMLLAARKSLAAQQVVRSAKESRGLMQPAAIDPNRTGLIGPEWSEITTTLGILPAKRSTTNPDFAAALVRLLGRLGLPSGAPVLFVLSGSLVGANVAAIIAAEALGLTPVIVSSLGASMYGATDLEFSWLDIEAVLAGAGVIASRSLVSVIGGARGVGRGLDPVGRAALAASAARHAVPIIEEESLAAVIDQLVARVRGAVPEGPALIVNIGGSLVGIGTCAGNEALPPGLMSGPVSCRDGVPGLVGHFASRSAPLLHILNIRRLARELALPYDPIPLPEPGRNRKVYAVAGNL